MIWSSTCWWTVGFSIGQSSSTRRSRLRGIQSADEMNTLACGDGSVLPLPKQTMRACSRKRPTMLLTRIFSERPGDAGPQAADAAHHQVDLHARLARPRRARRSIPASTSELSLAQIAAGLPARGIGDLGVDQLAAASGCMVTGENDELLQPLGLGVAGHEVEQPRRVAAQRRIAGEQRQVGVDPRGDRVVVAGAEMDSRCASRPRLAAHHHRHLGVGLELDEAVDHLHAGAFQVARPADVGLLVEAGLDLDQRGDGLAGLGRLDQRRRRSGESCEVR